MKKLRWAVINGLFVALIYFGFVEEVKGAERVAVFWAWAVSVLSLFLLNDKAIELAKKKPPFSVPRWVDGLYDVCIISAFVWFGAIATGAAFAVHLLMLQAFWAKVEEA